MFLPLHLNNLHTQVCTRNKWLHYSQKIFLKKMKNHASKEYYVTQRKIGEGISLYHWMHSLLSRKYKTTLKKSQTQWWTRRHVQILYKLSWENCRYLNSSLLRFLWNVTMSWSNEQSTRYLFVLTICTILATYPEK